MLWYVLFLLGNLIFVFRWIGSSDGEKVRFFWIICVIVGILVFGKMFLR